MKRVRTWLLCLVLLAVVLFPGIGMAEGFTSDVNAIERAAESVMLLEVYDEDGSYLGSASGFIAFDSQTLVTNYHVIKGIAGAVAESDSGVRYPLAYVYASDEDLDLAILGFAEPTELVPMELGALAEVRRAQPIVAIGSQLGLTNLVSKGNVSAMFQEYGVACIQFTAPVSPGSSGGALLNDAGQVIGVTSSMFYDAQNLNTAVSSDEVQALYETWDGVSRMTFAELSQSKQVPQATVAAPSFDMLIEPTVPERYEETLSERDFSVYSSFFAWCETGINESRRALSLRMLERISLPEIEETLPDRAYYLILDYSMDSADLATHTTLTCKLMDGEECVASLEQAAVFGTWWTYDSYYYIPINSLLAQVSDAGTYEIVVDDGDHTLTTLTLVLTDANGVAPTARPTATQVPWLIGGMGGSVFVVPTPMPQSGDGATAAPAPETTGETGGSVFAVPTPMPPREDAGAAFVVPTPKGAPAPTATPELETEQPFGLFDFLDSISQ